MTKTVTFAIMHFSVAFTVAYLLTGSLVVGGAVALALGLGRTTNSPFKGETAGIVPDADWYDRRFGSIAMALGVGWFYGGMVFGMIPGITPSAKDSFRLPAACWYIAPVRGLICPEAACCIAAS